MMSDSFMVAGLSGVAAALAIKKVRTIDLNETIMMVFDWKIKSSVGLGL
jgi:hypothetical protein